MMSKNFLLFLFLLMSVAACHNDSMLRMPDYSPAPDDATTGDQYAQFEENPFVETAQKPLSTFSIDADGAAYANVRRFLTQDQQTPPRGAIRTEELINYFDLPYPSPTGDHPIRLNGEISSCPWNADHRLVRIGIKGKTLTEQELPGANFVFLIDVSGSMASEDKLDLLKAGFKRFVDVMSIEDRVAIVTYASQAGVLLPSTPGTDKKLIKAKIDALGAGGATAGSEGIETAYEIAQQHFIPGGNNRIIIGTDGDFNVGIHDYDELVQFIEKKRKQEQIFLTILGVGRGNLNDVALEQMANHGNGTYEYIDHLGQLNKVFLFERSKFYTVAKDVKIQVNFNSNWVEAYRLIGYENRVLNNEDFIDDQKDAGEIGAGQNITALYEIIPREISSDNPHPALTVDFRYKLPEANQSVPMQLDIVDYGVDFLASSEYMRFTASVAAFSQLLRSSAYIKATSYDDVHRWLQGVDLVDEHGFKQELVTLVEAAKHL